MALDPLTIASLVNSGYNLANDIMYNTEAPVSDDATLDTAVRGTAEDRHLLNQLSDLILTGNGLWGESSRERNLNQGLNYLDSFKKDFSQVNNKVTLANAMDANTMMAPTVNIPNNNDFFGTQAASMLNNKSMGITGMNYGNAYNQLGNISKRELRNYQTTHPAANGGSLDELNGVTEFNVGNSHENNPYGGIQQGIASDGNPNLVEENEVKYKDYIYSARLKPSKSLLKEFNLPEKYFGKTFAELADVLQKESEERPNDPVSKTTLDEWMLRLQNAQEEYKAKAEERRLARVVDSMSDEEKAILLSSLEQPMVQQEGIDLSQPMYAKGGKIHIKPSKRGTFTAAAKKHGKSVQAFASQVLANKENYSPAMVKKANFARNTAKWKHANGGHLFDYGGDDAIFSINNANTLEALADKYPITANKYPIPDGLISDYPSYLLLEGNTQTSPIGNGEVKVSPFLAHYYDEPDLKNPIWKKGIYTETFPSAKDDNGNYVIKPPFIPERQIDNVESKFKFNPESLRYAPAIGAGIGALAAALQPKDYDLANRYRSIAASFRPISASHIGGYRRYTPYDINLGDAENLALQTAALNANRGQNRATQGALNTAVLAKTQETNAKRNLAAQQANEANRLAVDTYNLGIDRFNAERDSQYDQLNQQILNNKLNMLGKAAEAEDASKTAWANMYNATHENLYNQLGNVGRDEWNRNQRDFLLKALGREGLLELIKSGYFKS